MFHTYEEALNWIHSRLRLGVKPGVKRMEWMMERLNDPERSLKTIHVGGTNGKGSTVSFLCSILQTAGYKIGTFTSPYFEQFNERISVNGKPISDDELLQLVNIIKPLADELEKTELGGPTEFEIITALAIYYFSKINQVDVVIFEVGLGGRFDSTNIIHPILSIITSIGLDHTNILGNTLGEIAFEKAGIIKNGTPLLTAVKQPEALHVLLKEAESKKAQVYKIGEEFSVTNHVPLPKGETFSVNSIFKQYTDLKISLIGEHQTENAALAVMASIYLTQFFAFQIEEDDVRTGLEAAYWPGRFEIISEGPLIIIDGAHNKEGINSLAAAIQERYPNKKIHVVFAALNDKKLDEMINKIDELAADVTFVDFPFQRAASAAQLYHISKSLNKHQAANWRELLINKLQLLEKDEVLIITGSLYFISEVKPFLVQLRQKNE